MKKQLLLVAALCLAAAQAWGQVVVASGTCGAEGDGSNLTWTLTDTGTLTISGEGKMGDYAYVGSILPWQDYQDDIRSVTIADGVTHIGNRAFFGCSNLASLSIPTSVVSIGYEVLYGSGISLDKNNWTDGTLYIDQCLMETDETLQGTYSIEPGTRVIAGETFFFCTELTSVDIPASVVSIGFLAFNGCSGLTSITIPEGDHPRRCDEHRGLCLQPMRIDLDSPPW